MSHPHWTGVWNSWKAGAGEASRHNTIAGVADEMAPKYQANRSDYFRSWLLSRTAQDAVEVTLQFLSFPKSIDPKPVELLIGDGKTIEVNIPTNEMSAPYKVKQQGTWAVGKSVTREDGKPAFKAFGSSKALASPKQLILLLRKGPENADGMDVIAIDNQVKNFGGGKFLFMNAAKIDIAGVVGEEKFAIKPGQHIILKPKAELEERDHCQTSFYFRKEEEAKTLFQFHMARE